MTDKTTIIMATQNKGKLAEINRLTADFNINIISMNEAGLSDLEIDENGSSCEENSFIKANAVAKLKNMPAIADDAGLFVNALGGAPGIYSARYAGEHGDDAANRKLLLRNMAGIADRSAYFICVITLVYPDGKTVSFTGKCPGQISREEIGTEGFGYDSVFIPDGYNLTFAQLGVAEKNTFSHRAKALAQLKDYLGQEK